MKNINPELVRRIFENLNGLNRFIDKNRKYGTKCEKQIYIDRISKLIVPKTRIKLITVENKEERVNLLSIGSIAFKLGYGDAIEVRCFDITNINLSGITILGFSYSELLKLKYRELTPEESIVIDKLFDKN